jgi:putative transcription antitermination factor YqgF
VGLIVLGNPISLKGEPTEMSKRIERFRKKLKKSVEIEVVMWDERYLSKYAVNRMRNFGMSGKKEEIDRIAAAIMLEEYLESKRA